MRANGGQVRLGRLSFAIEFDDDQGSRAGAAPSCCLAEDPEGPRPGFDALRFALPRRRCVFWMFRWTSGAIAVCVIVAEGQRSGASSTASVCVAGHPIRDKPCPAYRHWDSAPGRRKTGAPSITTSVPDSDQWVPWAVFVRAAANGLGPGAVVGQYGRERDMPPRAPVSSVEGFCTSAGWEVPSNELGAGGLEGEKMCPQRRGRCRGGWLSDPTAFLLGAHR